MFQLTTSISSVLSGYPVVCFLQVNKGTLHSLLSFSSLFQMYPQTEDCVSGTPSWQHKPKLLLSDRHLLHFLWFYYPIILFLLLPFYYKVTSMLFLHSSGIFPSRKSLLKKFARNSTPLFLRAIHAFTGMSSGP